MIILQLRTRGKPLACKITENSCRAELVGLWMGARGQSKLKHTVAVINYTTNKRNRLTPTQIILQELIHFAKNWITQNTPYLYLVSQLAFSGVFAVEGICQISSGRGRFLFFFTRRRDDDCSLEAPNFRPRSCSPETRETEL
jgi:hypothetical protein